MAATAHGERNLNPRGVTTFITFDVQYHDQSRFRGTCTRLVAKTQINRRDFGVGQGSIVDIVLPLAAVQPPEEVREVYELSAYPIGTTHDGFIGNNVLSTSSASSFTHTSGKA
jgi:polyisoprenoid-binding protein YceI